MAALESNISAASLINLAACTSDFGYSLPYLGRNDFRLRQPLGFGCVGKGVLKVLFHMHVFDEYVLEINPPVSHDVVNEAFYFVGYLLTVHDDVL